MGKINNDTQYILDSTISPNDTLIGSDADSSGRTKQYSFQQISDYLQDYVGGGGGDGIQSIVAGTGVSVDDTDPLNPIVASTVNAIQSIVAGTGVSVDDTDPLNPIVTCTVTGGDELLAVDSTQNADFDVTDVMTSGMVKVDSATDITVTVRDFATHPIPVGSVIAIMQANAGTITVNYTGSATGDALKTFRDGDVLSLWHEEQDKWTVINPPHALDSTTASEPAGSDQVLNIVTLTQAEYDAAVGSHNAETLYIITS